MEHSDSTPMEHRIAKLDPPVGRLRSPRMPRFRADSRPVFQLPENKSQGRRCRCGNCALCKEDARWERIFREKFADPEYYSRRSIRYESPLNEW
jgi:hypothetical protein